MAHSVKAEFKKFDKTQVVISACDLFVACYLSSSKPVHSHFQIKCVVGMAVAAVISGVCSKIIPLLYASLLKIFVQIHSEMTPLHSHTCTASAVSFSMVSKNTCS